VSSPSRYTRSGALHTRVVRGGRSWSAPQVHVWTVKDGKAMVFREYEGDQQGDDEFWSSHE
jgi:ketosteroid isomerase-like protein